MTTRPHQGRGRQHGFRTPDPGWCGDPGRGAGMGRPSDLAPDTTVTLTLTKVVLHGDYDEGGAYWGGGDDVPGVWCAADAEAGEERYVRAWSRAEAMAQFPKANFLAEDCPHLDEFVEGYVCCALWITMGDDPDFKGRPQDNPGGVPLDENRDRDDLAPQCEARMVADCRAFLTAYGRLIEDATLRAGRGHDKWASAGHDFWLSRCRTGGGFDDGDWTKPHGEKLARAARQAGEVSLYVGDDGKVYDS